MDNKNLTKEQVKGILDNAPANLDKKMILQKLVERGFKLEGLNAAPKAQQQQQVVAEGAQANDFLSKKAPAQIFTKEFLKEVPEAAYQTLVGNALKFVKSAAEAPANIIESAQGKEATTLPLKDPVTGKEVGSFQTDFQNKTIPAVESGEISPLAATASTVGQVGLGALDVAGAGSLVKGGAKVAKAVPGLVKSAGTKVVDTVKNVNIPGVKALKDTAVDIIPTAADLRDRAIAKALRLAPVEDLSVIKQSTGNEVGEFMNRFELVKDTPGETVDALVKFQRQNFDRTRDAIALVDEKFTVNDIPQIDDTINFLIKDLSGRKSPEYVQALNKLKDIKQKGEFELIDAQYVKNLFDDVESIYKRSGDVRDAVSAQDKAQTIAPVRRFIEDRVAEKYPDVDIRALNNNVQTSRAIIDATLKRAPKADTSSLFQLGDLAVLGVGNAQLPGLGYAALFTKKVFESSPIQLRLSRFFAGKAKPADVVKGLTPQKLKEIDKLITQELKDAITQEDDALVRQLRQVKSAVQKESQSTTPTNTSPNASSIPKVSNKKK